MVNWNNYQPTNSDPSIPVGSCGGDGWGTWEKCQHCKDRDTCLSDEKKLATPTARTFRETLAEYATKGLPFITTCPKPLIKPPSWGPRLLTLTFMDYGMLKEGISQAQFDRLAVAGLYCLGLMACPMEYAVDTIRSMILGYTCAMELFAKAAGVHKELGPVGNEMADLAASMYDVLEKLRDRCPAGCRILEDPDEEA